MESKDIFAWKEEIEADLAARSYSAIREKLTEENATDIAALLREMSPSVHPILYRLLPKEKAAEVFVEMDKEEKEALINAFSDKELRDTLEELYMDDTVDLVEEMPANVVERILRHASVETRREINDLLRYPKDSAGTVMTTEYVLLKSTLTVAEAFAVIRKVALDKETVYTCYVTDLARHLIGTLSVKDMLVADPSATVSDIMEQNVISVTTVTDKEEVAKVFDRYHLLAVPVVDGENRLVGIVTVDDAIGVLQDEAEEDFAKMAAMIPTQEPYLRSSVFRTYLSRIPWLLLLMVTATVTGGIISSFEKAISVCVALTAFLPMLMDTGGNSGSQASVSVIRGLSLGEITPRDVPKVLFKELRVATLCGLSLGAVAFGKILLVDYLLLGSLTAADMPVYVALVVSFTLALTVIAAKLIGAILPIIAKALRLDPAVMASPFITTVVDIVSLLLYFQIASSILIPMLV